MSAPVSSSSSHNRHEEMENGVRERESANQSEVRSERRVQSNFYLCILMLYHNDVSCANPVE